MQPLSAAAGSRHHTLLPPPASLLLPPHHSAAATTLYPGGVLRRQPRRPRVPVRASAVCLTLILPCMVTAFWRLLVIIFSLKLRAAAKLTAAAQLLPSCCPPAHLLYGLPLLACHAACTTTERSASSPQFFQQQPPRPPRAQGWRPRGPAACVFDRRVAAAGGCFTPPKDDPARPHRYCSSLCLSGHARTCPRSFCP